MASAVAALFATVAAACSVHGVSLIWLEFAITAGRQGASGRSCSIPHNTSEPNEPGKNGYRMNDRQVQPVFIVGVSGATWDVLMPLVEQGRTPNIAGLLDRGTAARLASVRVSGDKHYRMPVAWA